MWWNGRITKSFCLFHQVYVKINRFTLLLWNETDLFTFHIHTHAHTFAWPLTTFTVNCITLIEHLFHASDSVTFRYVWQHAVIRFKRKSNRKRIQNPSPHAVEERQKMRLASGDANVCVIALFYPTHYIFRFHAIRTVWSINNSYIKKREKKAIDDFLNAKCWCCCFL